MGSLINVKNDNSVEVKKRILLANKGFYGLKKRFRSHFLSIKKGKLCNPLTRPVLACGSEIWVLSRSDEASLGACGSEIWVLSRSDEASLGVFERKILRAIFGPTNDNGEWRIRYNNEPYTLYKENDRVTYKN